MPKVTIITGLILIALGLVGYFVLGGDAPSKTALIPAFFGVPIAGLGLLAMRPNARKIAMHIAVVLGLLGFIAPLGRVIPVAIKGELQLVASTFMLISMAVVCLVFVVLCVRSFMAARKAAGAS
jgi:multisubunit Na+/H+ antiporter MnhF subunit